MTKKFFVINFGEGDATYCDFDTLAEALEERSKFPDPEKHLIYQLVESLQPSFNVLDLKTGQMADLNAVADEQWAKRLVYTDIGGFALTQDGSLVLMDECGNFVYCPPKRFEVKWLPE
jgi:hypothetical protein